MKMSYQSGPYCPHCSKLNRYLSPSEQLPTDHYVRKTRDPNSPVICPELLKTLCSECGKLGHTKLYCVNKMTSWRNQTTTSSPPVNNNKSNNRFADLSDSDSSINSEEEFSPVIFRPQSPDYPPPWLADDVN